MTPHAAGQHHLTHPKYRADIDGLRAVAILSVVGYHAFPGWVKGGFIGVDIFFVISGLLISTIIFGSLDKNAFSFREFYARRIKRIFPALILVMAASYALGWFVLLPDEYMQLGKHIAAGAGFVSNFFFWQEAGYFDNAAETKPMLHLWSLGIEEQFYIVWPLLLYLTWKRRFNLLFLTVAIITISFTVNVVKVHDDSVQAFYSPVSRFWELMLGSVLAYLTLHKTSFTGKAKQRIALLCNAQSMLGVAAIGIAVLVINREKAFPGWWALLPTLGAYLIISAGPQAWLNRVVLSHRAMVWLGLISYPLYLWHWPLLSFARIVESGALSREIRIAAVLTSIALAWLTYKLVEKPIRFGDHGRAKITVLCVLMMIIGYAGFGTYKYEGLSFRNNNGKAQDLLWQPNANNKFIPCPADVLSYYSHLNNCALSSNNVPTLAIFGDSHAAHLFPGIVEADKNNTWQIIGSNACPPIIGIEVTMPLMYDPQFKLPQNCKRRSEEAVEYLLNTPSIHTVVFSFFGGYILNTTFSADDKTAHFKLADIKLSLPGHTAPSENKVDLFYSGIEMAISALEREGKSIVIFIDISELPFFPRDCIRRPAFLMSDKTCKLPKPIALERQEKLRGMLNRLVTAHPKVRLYDPFNLLCDNEYCNFENDEMLFYRDSNHLSFRGSTFVARDFLKWLSKN